MADYVVNKNESFEFTYSAKEQEEVERIRNKYLPKKESKMEQLRNLDKAAEKPGTMVAIAVGVVGSLVLGIGMCCTMVWADTLFIPGIFIGILGMAIAGCAHPIYKKITAGQRAKIADQIIALSNELSLEN